MEIVIESNLKLNKLWVDQGREFCNKLMQEWLGNNDILMYCTHNEGKSVTAERFIKTLKSTIYKKMKANDSELYLSYLNKLVEQYNNVFKHSINEIPINANYSAFTEKIETDRKAAKFKVNVSDFMSELLSIRVFVVKFILKLGQEKHLSLILF